MEDRDFIDFKFGDHWASDFNLLAVSSGDRYSPPVYGSVNPNTATIAGKVGVYKWKTQVNEKVFNIKIAFDNINGQILNQIKEWLNPFKIDKLVFKEEPYKYYWVALNTEPKLDFLPFLEETKVVNGIAFKEGVYKGEFELQFVCFDNYGYSDWQSFDENYDYVVKEIEGEEFISFSDGSDNNLIITKIEGNSKQRTREEVPGTVISGSEMTINEEYISNKTQFVINGQSEQKTTTGKNILPYPYKDTSKTSNGITWVDNGDGTITANGTANADSIFTLVSQDNTLREKILNKTITISGAIENSSSSTSRIQLWNYNSNGNLVFDYGEGASVQFTNESANYNIAIVIVNGFTANNIKFKPMIEIGNTKTSYEPYTGGQPSPNPEYPQEVEIIDGVNLAYIGWAEDFVSRINYTPQASITEFENKNCLKYSAAVGSGDLDTKYIFKTNWKENTQYTIKCDFYTSQGSTNFAVNYTDGSKEYIGGRGYTAGQWINKNMTTSANKTVKYLSVSYDLGSTYIDIDTFMVYEGTTPKPYLPYGHIGLRQSGKNLFDGEFRQGSYNNLTYASRIFNKNNLYLKANTTYILKTNLNTSKFKFGVMVNDKEFPVSTLNISYDSGWQTINELRFTTTQNGYFGFNIAKSNGTDNLTIDDIKSVEFTLSDKEEKIYPINLNGNSIAKVEDVKDLLKVYRNGDVEIKKKIVKFVKNVFTESYKNDVCFYFQTYLDYDKTHETYTEMNNYFKHFFNSFVAGVTGSMLSWDGKLCCSVKYGEFGFTEDMTETEALAKINDIVSNKPIEIYCKLHEDSRETIKLPAIDPIELWEGTNKFELITNLDTTMELTYNYLPALPSVEENSEIKNVTGNANIVIGNKNLAKINESEWILTNKNTIKNKGATGGRLLTSFFVKKGQNVKLNLKMISKPTLSTTFTTKINGKELAGTHFTEIQNSNLNTINTKTYIAEEDAKIEVRCYGNANNDIFEFQYWAEIAETTDYIKHQSQNFTMPVQQEMLDIDYFDFDNEEEINHFEKYVFTGEENWSKSGATTDTIFVATMNISNWNAVSDTSDVLSNRFTVSGKTKIDSIFIYNNGENLRLCFDASKINTIEQVKSFLKDNNTYCYYKTKTEKKLPFTEEQKAVLDEIKNNLYSYEGTNHIFSTDEVSPLLSISYVPKQDIYIDYVVNQSNLLNDSAFYYENNIHKKSYFDAETGDATKSGISEDRPVYLYNAGTTTSNLNLTFDMIIPAEGSPLVINTESCKLTNNGIKILKQISSISVSNFSKYKPFLEIYDETPSNWQIQIDSNLCEIYLKHKTDKTKIISLNKFNDNQSFLSLANCNFVDYSKPFPTLITAISGTALENTVFNKLSVGASAQNYRLKNVNVEWKHTYL